MKELTGRQDMVLAYVRRHIVERQRPPSIRELAHAFGLSPHGVSDHIEAVIRKGHLARDSEGYLVVPGELLEWRAAGTPSREEILHELELARTALRVFA